MVFFFEILDFILFSRESSKLCREMACIVYIIIIFESRGFIDFILFPRISNFFEFI